MKEETRKKIKNKIISTFEKIISERYDKSDAAYLRKWINAEDMSFIADNIIIDLFDNTNEDDEWRIMWYNAVGHYVVTINFLNYCNELIKKDY